MNLYKILAFVLKSILLLSISSQAQNTFKVDSVKVASKPLKVFNVDTLLKLKTQHQIVYMPESLKGIKLHPSYNNGLVDAVYEAYSSHRPLILSPDIVWLTISQGVSIHINQNFDKLKTKLFKSPEPVQLLVRNDSIEIKPQYWTSVINEFAGQTKANTKGDFYNILVPQFSTTTKDITTAYQINLMETYRQAFEYLGESGCGIPTITLEGTKEDWQLIYNQLDNLNQFGLQEWVKELKPVIQEFINTYDQKTNQKFWSSIYKDASEYGAFYVSGWIIKFFPYLTGLDFDSKVVQDKSKGNDENDFTRKVKKNYYLNQIFL